jgi:hypothetical protein
MLSLLFAFMRRQGAVVWAYIALAIAVAGVLLGVRNAGRQAERIQNLQSTMKAVMGKNAIENHIAGADSNERKRLRAKWMRRD